MDNLNPALQNRDFTVIIDKSGSMGSPEHANNPSRSRWLAAQEATVALARECNKYDPDGITVYAFSTGFKRYDNTTEEKVADIFSHESPNGSTRLDTVLRDALLGPNGYVTRKKKGQAKAGELFCVITDGQPDDEKAVAQVIIEATHQLTDPSEVNITFIQVGDDAHAKQFLTNLDDQLEAPAGKEGQRGWAKYDIVDTLTIDDMGGKNLADVLVAAITEHKQST